jgi:outer membrane scaffolding protein for murein synthesis (MipA/OmpV family)
VLAACVALPAGADERTAPTPAGIVTQRPLWELGIGVAALSLPDYRGSDQSRGYLLPFPYVVYRGDWLRADRDGARAYMYRDDRIKLDLSLSAGVPVESKKNQARQGMPDLPFSVEVGPNLEINFARTADDRVRFDVRLPLRVAVGVERSPDVIGAIFSPHVALDWRSAAGWKLGFLTGPYYGDQRYHQHYYGVAPQFATPQRPAYSAPGGYGGWQALASLSRRFGALWVGAYARGDDLHGAAYADSPLVRRHSAFSGGAGVAWVFGASGRVVAADD